MNFLNHIHKERQRISNNIIKSYNHDIEKGGPGSGRRKTVFNKTQHLSSIVEHMTKDKRRRGFSTQDIHDAAEHLGIDTSVLSDHDDKVIKLHAIKQNKPTASKKDFHPTWTKEALDEAFGKD